MHKNKTLAAAHAVGHIRSKKRAHSYANPNENAKKKSDNGYKMTNNQNVFAIKIPITMLVQTYKHSAETQEEFYAFPTSTE